MRRIRPAAVWFARDLLKPLNLSLLPFVIAIVAVSNVHAEHWNWWQTMVGWLCIWGGVYAIEWALQWAAKRTKLKP